jgi:hypothetical protein
MSFDFPFVRLFGVRHFCYFPYLALIIFIFYLKQNGVLIITRQDEHVWYATCFPMESNIGNYELVRCILDVACLSASHFPYADKLHLFILFIRPSLRRDVLWYTNVRLSVRLSVHLSVRLFVRPFHMSRSNLRTPWPINFKFHRVIGIDVLTVCILYGEISNFHSRVVELYSSNCRWFFVCRAVNCETLGQFTSNFA